MLIEKAATEKAVREVDEALSSAISARRKHREQTGQPFYDMLIFSNGNQRYPAALPEQLGSEALTSLAAKLDAAYGHLGYLRTNEYRDAAQIA